MLIGLIGKPNAGKTTLFNALTHGRALVANYPFTTIDPNKGVAFVHTRCPCVELGTKCAPRFGNCVEGERTVPINVIDVAGLVECAHEGKGRGNQFLNDLNQADALVCLADASGSSDDGGNPCEPGSHEPARDVKMIEEEIDYWILDVLKRNLFKAKGKKLGDLAQYLSGIRVSEDLLKRTVTHLGMDEEIAAWKNEAELMQLAKEIRKATKPIVIAANKIDSLHAEKNIASLMEAFPNQPVIPVAADSELALQRAKEKRLIEYDGSAVSITSPNLDPKIKNAFDIIDSHVIRKYGSTGVQELLQKTVFEVLDCVVAYPVEDEKHYADHFGRVLPDAVLLPKGSKALDLAGAVHSELAAHFLYAVNVRNGMRLARDYEVKNRDVIKIVSTK